MWKVAELDASCFIKQETVLSEVRFGFTMSYVKNYIPFKGVSSQLCVNIQGDEEITCLLLFFKYWEKGIDQNVQDSFLYPASKEFC